MGNACYRFIRNRVVRRKIVLLMIGLDNAGKTQTVNHLIGDSKGSAIPTVGFKAVNLVHKNTPVVIFDLGGGPTFRHIWPLYYSEVHGIIFVIDSSDLSRLEECKNVLEEVLSHERISGKPVLILANKQDRDGALDDLDIVEKLNIETVVNRYRCPTFVESYSASIPVKQKCNMFSHHTIDPGLKKGYVWLLNYILRKYGDINLRVKTDINAEAMKTKARVEKANSVQVSSNHDEVLDIEEVTGFSNLTYKEEASDKIVPSVINVKPALSTIKSNNIGEIAGNGVDHQNMGIVSHDHRPASNRLSPLFGKKSEELMVVGENPKLELQPRLYVTKLTPLHTTKDRTLNVPSDQLKQRPHSSPEINMFKSRQHSPSPTLRDSYTTEEVKRSGNTGRTLPNIDDSSEKIAPGRIADSITVSAEIVERPVSASQVIRKQLEQAGSVSYRRRLTLKNIRRNRTSPEEILPSHAIFSHDLSQKGEEVHDKGALKSKSTPIEMTVVAPDKGEHTNRVV